MNRYVYPFDQIASAQAAAGGDWDAVRRLLGGKGANLGDMTRAGVPVPPGFTIATTACNEYLKAGAKLPDGLWEEIVTALGQLEESGGRRFGDADGPLLLSCRSGAPFSMPGMMDTVLNIGLNRSSTDVLSQGPMGKRMAYDLYRRLLQMFGGVVLGIDDHAFEHLIRGARRAAGVSSDSELSGEAWQTLTAQFESLVEAETGAPFPDDPYEQLRQAVEAVFRSWNGKRAVDYRNAVGIPHELGTGVNVQTMVYGNFGDDSATGVCMSRNATNGRPEIEGDYLFNAQGEDVVAGIRATLPISELKQRMPAVYDELEAIAARLETHHRDMQDIEFTIERGKLWLLQTRDGKRTAQAAVRIAADLVDEGVIDRREAVSRVAPEQIDFFLHPHLDAESAEKAGAIARGLNVSPGAAVGRIALDPDRAERWAQDGEGVILVRHETRPDDVHGMLAAEGVLTSRGGRTSHAALVARQFGKPAVVGVEAMDIDMEARAVSFDGRTLAEGDWVSLDGSAGEVYGERLPTVVPDFDDPHLLRVLGWADEIRRLGVRANADYPRDAERALAYGAEGIGLCRTEHMFFEEERLPIVQQMIMATDEAARDAAIDLLRPAQRSDFEGLLRAMDGLPVIVRLLDPPLHEFLPSENEVRAELTELRTDRRLTSEDGGARHRIEQLEGILRRVQDLQETNPMLGTRGVRLGILIPGLYRMQVRALVEAACACTADGLRPRAEVMIPLVADARELQRVVGVLREEAGTVMAEAGAEVPLKFGTMIEIPRAALTSGAVAGEAEFFSFGTNDLTQTVYGISRDDAEAGFLVEYLESGVLPQNPFATVDREGVARLMHASIADGRQARPDLEVGVCGEHGGDPASIAIFHDLGLDYVSCSPFRVPIARLAAAHAAMRDGDR